MTINHGSAKASSPTAGGRKDVSKGVTVAVQMRAAVVSVSHLPRCPVARRRADLERALLS